MTTKYEADTKKLAQVMLGSTLKNPSELAKAMLVWEDMRRKADNLEDDIKAAVLKMTKTQVVGNVRATYNRGRKQYDYERGVMLGFTGHDNDLEEVVTNHTEPRVAWKDVCKELEIEDIPFTQAKPSVTLKLEG